MKRYLPESSFAVCVGLLVLLAGFALIRATANQRTIAERMRLTETGAELSRRVSHQLDQLSESVMALMSEVERGGKDADFPSIVASFKSEPSLAEAHLTFLQYAESDEELLPEAGVNLRTLDWDLSSANEQRMKRPELIGPLRKINGEWLALLRTPVWVGNGEGGVRPAGWIVSIFELESLLAEAGINRVSFEDIAIRLAYFSPGNPRLRTLTRSAELDLIDPIRQVIDLTQDRWILLLAPKQGWTPWTLIALHGVLILALAFFSAGVAQDLKRKPEHLQAKIDTRDGRLKIANERLSEEIRQRENIEEQFHHANSHDPFTGLPNRSYFMDRLGRALRRARLEPSYVAAVIILKLDRIKTINETHGVAAGDQLLTQCVERLQSSLRPEDLVVSRLADDEFAILLFDIGTAQAAAAAARRLEGVLAEPFSIESRSVFVKAHMGISLSSSGYEEAEELVLAAHMALSKARTGGGENYAIFESATREQIVSRQQLETDLYQAVERNEFCLYLQPIVSLNTRSIVGMECLIRWRHPFEGLVSPSAFIPLAEETGLIVQITRWGLKEACRIAQYWLSQGSNSDFYLSVNLSAQDLSQPDIQAYVAEVLRETGIPGGVLRLELTESMMIGNLGAVNELVSGFREMNIPLLLDDFGTGYSSLSYLNRVHFDYIKIDRSFVSRIGMGDQNSGIVKAIVHLAQDLGSKTIAEGIESIECVERLHNLGCDFGQGYYFSKPLEVQDAHQLLLSRPKWDHSVALSVGCR